MSSRSGRVQTVLGLVDPVTLGHTQTHEHLLCDPSGYLGLPFVHQLFDSLPREQLAHVDEPIRLENVYWIRKHRWNKYNIGLSDRSEAIDEMHRYRAAGGGTVVEATSLGIGRDPEGLEEISKASDVHVVMGAGYYWAPFHPPEVQEASVSELTEQITQDALEGVNGSGVKAGIIGEIGLGTPPHPDEDKVLRAAAAAQAQTGLPIVIHPALDFEAPAGEIAALETVRAAGGDPERTVMGHIDSGLFMPPKPVSGRDEHPGKRFDRELEAMLQLAATGCYLAFDCFGNETRPFFPSDVTRIDYLIALIERGFSKQLLISQDVCEKVHLRKYGGEGYTHILENVIPIMRGKGLSDDDLETILVENPIRVLTIV